MTAKQNALNTTVADAFGQIVWLMTQSPQHRDLSVSDLEWLVMPPVLLRQFKVFLKDGKPIAVILWARFSPEAEKRFTNDRRSMQFGDWASGMQAKIIDIIAPFGGEKELCEMFERELPTLLRQVGVQNAN